MAKIAQNLLELIGNTPLVQLSRFAQTEGLNCPHPCEGGEL